ncbi:hypothetical protein ACIHCM_26035 [Streptomyces sp. NPDC052023]|uniref:hypothetical protein n=1 Tax=Streptomyces sp. NPDC052023 TaxID=3365681 RepID=UPI0037CFC9A7
MTPLTSGNAYAPHDRRPARPVSGTRISAPDTARIISDPSTPVFVTVQADGRRRYGYWRPYDPTTGQGSCYVALPTDECDSLHAAGRITLGEPVVDPSRTTYRVRAARTPARPLRALPGRALAA